MNPHLQKQQEAFKNTLLRQTRASAPPTTVAPAASSQAPLYPSTGAGAGNLTTIAGRPINSYVHSIISYLKVTIASFVPMHPASSHAHRGTLPGGPLASLER